MERETRVVVNNNPDSLQRPDWGEMLSGIYRAPLGESPVVIPESKPGNEFVLAVRQPTWGLVADMLVLMDDLGFWQRPYAVGLDRVGDDFVGHDRVMGFFGIRRPTPDPLSKRLARGRARFLEELKRLEESIRTS